MGGDEPGAMNRASTTGFGDGGIYRAGGEWAAVAMAENRGVEMKTFILFILAFVAAVCVAQPQAPVAWEEGKEHHVEYAAGALHPAALTGDTLVFVGAVPDQSEPPQYCPSAAASHDNGFTFGPWACLDSLWTGGPTVICNLFAGDAGHVFATVDGHLIIAVWTQARHGR